jgi:hypothetical protein
VYSPFIYGSYGFARPEAADSNPHDRRQIFRRTHPASSLQFQLFFADLSKALKRAASFAGITKGENPFPGTACCGTFAFAPEAGIAAKNTVFSLIKTSRCLSDTWRHMLLISAHTRFS